MSVITHRETEQSKRGFTLTEIAIVLGIIGLILGAIWVAAAAVYNNMRVSKATTELLQIAQGVRSMYATSSVVDTTIVMPIAGAVAAGAAPATYIQAGVFPTDSYISTGSPPTSYTPKNPWGYGIAVNPAQLVTNGDSFTVSFDGVPQNACVSMITGNTGDGRDQGLIGVSRAAAGTLPAAATNTVFPVTAATALTTYCTTNAIAGQAIGFTFRLKG